MGRCPKTPALCFACRRMGLDPVPPARLERGKGHWTSVAGYGDVFTTTELFDVTAARDHFDGTVEAGECRFCAFDARNREHHARNAGRLF